MSMSKQSRLVANPTVIRHARTKNGVTQTALAEAIGCTQAAISRIESGHSPGSLRTLSGISNALNTTLDTITQTVHH